jgi:hypothetical protein
VDFVGLLNGFMGFDKLLELLDLATKALILLLELADLGSLSGVKTSHELASLDLRLVFEVFGSLELLKMLEASVKAFPLLGRDLVSLREDFGHLRAYVGGCDGWSVGAGRLWIGRHFDKCWL